MGRLEHLDPKQKLYIALGIMLTIFAAGTAGYSIIEEWSVLDSAYMTVITLTTVGFQEVQPLSSTGRIFTIIIILSSMSTLAFTANVATRLIASGEIRQYMEKQRMRKSMERLENHFIICGFGRIGKRVSELFKMEKVPCVVVERSEDVALVVQAMGIPVIVGEATEEAVLSRAGIERAKCIITAVDSPADNVFITLTARDMNRNLHIVSRAESVETGAKLRRAGADRVVFPHQIGGRKMAQAALRPTLDRFLSMDTLREKYGVYMEEVHLAEDSELVGKTLAQSAISTRFGLTVIAILGKEQAADNLTFNPGSHYELLAGDALIVLGTEKQLGELEKIASGKNGRPHAWLHHTS